MQLNNYNNYRYHYSSIYASSSYQSKLAHKNAALSCSCSYTITLTQDKTKEKSKSQKWGLINRIQEENIV